MSDTFDELMRIMDVLREPGGCAWDREQDFDSMIGCLREELAEVEAAMQARDGANLREEIGDLLFNLIFVTRLGKEEGWFTMEDVLVSIRDKIVRRHPHVFGDAEASTPEEVLAQWQRIKEEERRG